MANIFKQIVKKSGQRLFLGHNFINKIIDDFYVLFNQGLFKGFK